MKTKIKIVSSILAAGLSISCASGPATSSQVKPYTSDTCIVTDNKLGSMGDPVSMIYNGQEVKFCCKPCVKKFTANPAKYLSKL